MSTNEITPNANLTGFTPENLAEMHAVWEEKQNDPEWIAEQELLEQYEASHDEDFIMGTLCELQGENAIKTNSREYRILNAIARNWCINSEVVSMVADMDDRFGLDITFHLAGNENLTQDQQREFAFHDDKSVRWALAHSRYTSTETLELLAKLESTARTVEELFGGSTDEQVTGLEEGLTEEQDTTSAKVLREVLNNPACTPVVRDYIDPEIVEEFDAELAAEIVRVSDLGEYAEEWDYFEPHTNPCIDLAAVLNPNLPSNLAGEYEVRDGLLGLLASARTETGSYTYLRD